MSDNDSIIDYLLKFNKTNPVIYKGKLIKVGELEKMLDALPTKATNKLGSDND